MHGRPVKLWLDSRRPAPAGWTHARTTHEARLLLLTSEVEAASLAFDLGRDRETGLDLVRWMTRTGNWPSTRPRTHGATLAFGRVRMLATIHWGWHRRAQEHDAVPARNVVEASVG